MSLSPRMSRRERLEFRILALLMLVGLPEQHLTRFLERLTAAALEEE